MSRGRKRPPAARERPPAGSAREPRSERVVFGLGPVQELLRRRPESIMRLHIRSRDGEPPRGRLAELTQLAADHRVAISGSDVAELDSLAGADANHQGAVALTGAYAYAELDAVIESVAPGRPLVVLDGVTDPHNLGAICRSAYLLGAAGIVIGRDRAAPINAVATKASAGATEYLDIAQVTNIARALEELREAGAWRAQIAATPEARPLAEIDASLPLALVLGSEGRGLRPLVARQTDFAFAIPMSGRAIGSFNVSVAASLALYEISRRRDSS